MNDDALESLLKNADRSTLPADISGEELAVNVRRRHMEWRRRRDRRVHGAILVGCYFAGALSMWLWTGSDDGRINSGVVSKSDDPFTAAKTETPPEDRKDSPIPAVPIVDVELETPYERYRRLGDDALMQDRDVEVAVDFYSRALEAASKTERGVALEGDSWVLIRLKQGQSDTSL